MHVASDREFLRTVHDGVTDLRNVDVGVGARHLARGKENSGRLPTGRPGPVPAITGLGFLAGG
ncbi:hypothetical protein GCM10018954_044980 [Kutzneria kofuensis]